MQPNGKAIYVILKSPVSNKNPGTQLALHVQILQREPDKTQTLCFYDTDRVHMIPGKLIGIGDHTFRFQDGRDCIWEMREVTIQEYRNRLENCVGNGREIANTIKTTESLWEHYRKQFPI